MRLVSWKRYSSVAAVPLVLFALSSTLRAQGVALSGVGSVNRSMGGASTAAPIDAAGAIHWNPGSISGLPTSEVFFGMEFLLPTTELSSSVDGLAGSTDGEPGFSPIPTVAWVHKSEGSRWTCGLGMYAVAGYRANYPSSTTNPVLLPQAQGGLGRIFAEAEFLQIAPTISYAVSDRLSVGVAPTVTMARGAIDPLVFAPPVPDLGYTSGRGTRYHWGGGVQAGIYYICDCDIHLGASIKSPQWFEPFRFNTEDALGAPRVVEVDIDYPMIISLGAAYSGIENWLLALDVRYFDYKNTDGFGDPAGFDATGAVTGLGWSNLFSLHTGLQHRLTDCFYWRVGYTYQQNPIHSADAFFNSGSALIIQHVLGVGASYYVKSNIAITAAYLHGFRNRTSGPINAPGVGPVPGTSVASEIAADAVSFGVTVRY